MALATDTVAKELNAGPKPLSLRRNISWAFVGNVVYAGCQWGMLVVLAKLGSPKMVGQFALGLALTAPIIILANIQLRLVQATDAKREYQFGDFFALRLLTTTLAFSLIFAIALASRYSWETTLVILAVGIAKAFEAISDIAYGRLQQCERMDYIARLHMIKGPLSLVAMGAALYISGSVIWATVALAATWALQLVVFDLPAVSRVQADSSNSMRPCWNTSVMAKLAWLALPLGVTAGLISFNANIPRYFIEHHLGEHNLGIFAAIAYFVVGGRVIVSALAQSTAPRLAQYYTQDGMRLFRRLLVKLVVFGAFLGALGFLLALAVGRQFLSVCYGLEYAGHVDVLAWLMVAAAISFMNLFLTFGLTAARIIKIQAPMIVLASVTIAISCMWLVPANGLKGATWAMLLGFLVQFAGGVFFMMHALRRAVKVLP